MTTINVNYAAGPPLTLNVPVLFGQGWNTLKSLCFPQAMDVLRLWDDGTRLGIIAPAENTFYWTVLDQRVEAAQAAGKRLLYTFGSTPAWAAVTTAGPAGMSDPTSNRPVNLTLIKPVLEAIVTRYKGKIYAYESWNEYNYSGFYCGTDAQLLEWQELLYTTVKAIDPEALVTLPTPCFSSTTVDVEIAKLLSLGFQKYADIVSMHGYLKPGLDGTAIGATLAKVRVNMAAASCTLPLWDTEFGFSGSTGGAALYTLAEQRQWVIDAFMTRLSYGVALMSWYQWDNLTHNPGVTDLTGTTLTPAGQAMVDLFTLLKNI